MMIALRDTGINYVPSYFRSLNTVLTAHFLRHRESQNNKEIFNVKNSPQKLSRRKVYLPVHLVRSDSRQL